MIKLNKIDWSKESREDFDMESREIKLIYNTNRTAIVDYNIIKVEECEDFTIITSSNDGEKSSIDVIETFDEVMKMIDKTENYIGEIR